MNRTLISLSCAAFGLVAVAPAAAQNLLFNPSFEMVNPKITTEPLGWHAIGSAARRRTMGDMLSPMALVRTGEASIEVGTDSDGGFIGFTTNILDPMFMFYDPPFEWMGGDVTVSGWYAIPAGAPITGDLAGIKLEFRRENTSIYQAFEMFTISGTTNGQFVPFSFTVRDEDLNPNFPPFPVAVSVLPARFAPDGTPTSGTIFWDDLVFTQGDACAVDLNGDMQVTIADFLEFLNLFASGDPRAEFDGNPGITVGDFLAFLNAFAAGC